MKQARQMGPLVVAALCAGVTFGVAGQPPAASVSDGCGSSVETFTARVKGMGSFELVAESGDPLRLKIGLAFGNTPNGTQRDEHEFVSYTKRCAATRDKSIRLPPYDVYSNCVVQISSRAPKIALNYYLLPNFNMSMGLYDHAAVQAFMPSWRKQYKLAPDREYEFLCVPDPRHDRTLLYLDGNIFESLPGVRRFVSAKSAAKGGAEIVATSFGTCRDAGDHYELPPQKDKANDLLRDGATLSVGTGPQVIAGVPITVWAPEESVDQARHRPTSATRTITYSPIYNRTPWATGPEFIQWTVPSRTWRNAHVLCAEIPVEGRVPTIGTTLGKFGNGCTVGNCATDFATLLGAETNANVKTVGTLAYRRDGRTVSAPLYLVTIPLSAFRLGVRGKKALTLDFEFIGAGTSDALPRSSVQIFGCTLEPTPFSYEIANPVRGNIFEQGTDRQVGGLDIVAHLDGVKMSYSWETYGPTNEVLDCGRETLAFEKAGERRHVEIDFSGYGVGWYGRDYTFYDADGEVASRHRSAFTVLAPDDREAGYESPYAAWPHLRGYHGANPDPREQLEVMRKLGARKTWSTPLGSEAEMAKWKVTLSTAGQAFSNPPWINRSPATVSNYIEKAIASIRTQKEKFPHVGVVQMLHETWGINVCSQVVNGVEGVRRPYRGWTDDCVTNRALYMAYTCTEYARRLKQEFPDLRIMLANGSGSSERVAQLAEDGLDLALVDQLGIECKGFTSLPECGSNRESPAALWALRETGRCFGFSNVTVNACNEYVFRCEREILRTADAETCLRMTGYAVRDYLISLAHGCDIISQGHLEDPADAYYDTNWGSGGLCTFYPFSYPKRMFTALAVLSRVLDKPVYRRSLPTGAGAAYALEFRRARAHADYALALWTPHYGVTMRVAYPAGTRVRHIDVFGRENALALDAAGAADLEVGACPCYLVADVPALSATVTATEPPVVPSGARTVTAVNASTVTVPKIDADWFDAGWKHAVKGRDPWGCPNPQVGTFIVRDVVDPQFAEPVTELELVPTGTCPAIRWENAYLKLNRPYRFKRSETKALAIAVCGNGSFARVHLVLRDPENPDTPMWHVPAGDERGFVAFDGWQTMVAPVPKDKSFLGYPEYDGVDEVELVGIDCGSARQALDPIEMRPVEGNVRIGPVWALVK